MALKSEKHPKKREIPVTKTKCNGFFMPMIILSDPDLTPSDKILLCYIHSFCKIEDKYFFVSNEHLIKHLHFSKANISKIIRRLVELDYIDKPFYNGKQRVISGTERLQNLSIRS